MRPSLALLAVLTFHEVAAGQELTGTPYTVLWRGNAYAQGAALTQGGVVLRVADPFARRELARAAFDTRLGGWLFQMPMMAPNAKPSACLALVDPRNQFIVVRRPSSIDPGYTFRNPQWEREFGRSAEIENMKQEHAAVDARMRGSADEIARLTSETGLPPNADASRCPLPAALPDPPRPDAALDAEPAARVSGPVCAWRWERDFGTRISNLGRMFSDAGLDADWRQRAEAAAVGEGMTALRVPITTGDFNLVVDAAAKGRTFMEHGDGVRAFSRAHAVCKQDVARQAVQVRQQWDAAVQEARRFPELSRQQCAQKLARVASLQAAQAAAPALLAALTEQIQKLSVPPAAGNPVPLHAELCQP